MIVIPHIIFQILYHFNSLNLPQKQDSADLQSVPINESIAEEQEKFVVLLFLK